MVVNSMSIPGNSAWGPAHFSAAVTGYSQPAALNTMSLLGGFSASPVAGAPIVPVFDPSACVCDEHSLRLAALTQGGAMRGFERTTRMIHEGVEAAFPNSRGVEGATETVAPEGWPSGWRLKVGETCRFDNIRSGQFFDLVTDSEMQRVTAGWTSERASVSQSAEFSASLGLRGVTYMLRIGSEAVMRHLFGIGWIRRGSVARAMMNLVSDSGQYPDGLDRRSIAVSKIDSEDSAFQIEMKPPSGHEGAWPLKDGLREALWDPLVRMSPMYRALERINPLAVDRTSFDGVRNFTDLGELISRLELPAIGRTREEDRFMDGTGRLVADIDTRVDVEGARFSRVRFHSWKDYPGKGSSDLYRDRYDVVYDFGREGAPIETRVERELAHGTLYHAGPDADEIWGGPVHEFHPLESDEIFVSKHSEEVPGDLIPEKDLTDTLMFTLSPGRFPDLSGDAMRRLVLGAIFAWRGLTMDQRRDETLRHLPGADVTDNMLSKDTILFPFIDEHIERQLARN